MPDQFTRLSELAAYNPQLPTDPLATPASSQRLQAPTAQQTQQAQPRVSRDALAAAINVGSAPPSDAEGRLLQQGILRQNENGQLAVSREGLLNAAQQDGWQNLDNFTRAERLRGIAEDVAARNPTPVSPDDVYQSLQGQFEGTGLDFDTGGGLSAGGVTRGLARAGMNVPAAVAGGVEQTADVASGLVDTAQGGLAALQGGIQSGLEAVVGEENLEAVDEYIPDVLNPLIDTAQMPLEGASTVAGAAQDVLEPELIGEARQRIEQLASEGRTADLAQFITTDPAGWAIASGVVAESLVPFAAVNRARQGLAATGAGREALQRMATETSTRASRATDAGVSSALLGTGQTASSLAEDQDQPFTPEQVAGALAAGGATGVLTGGAARLGPTPESVVARVMQRAPAEARTSAQGMRRFLDGMLGNALRGAGLEASSEGAQEAAQALVESGYDENGAWSADRVDPTAVETSAALGAAIGAVGGTGTGAIEGRQQNRARQQAERVERVQRQQREEQQRAQEEAERLAARTPAEVAQEEVATERGRAVADELAAAPQPTPESFDDAAATLDAEAEVASDSAAPDMRQDAETLRGLATRMRQEALGLDPSTLTPADPLTALNDPRQTPTPFVPGQTATQATPAAPAETPAGPAPGQADLFLSPSQPGQTGSLFTEQATQGQQAAPDTELAFTAQQRLDLGGAPASEPDVAQGELDFRADTAQGDLFSDPLAQPVQDALQDVRAATGQAAPTNTAAPPAQPDPLALPTPPATPVDSRGRARVRTGEPISEAPVDPLVREQAPQAVENPVPVQAGPSGVDLAGVAQAAADNELNLPPRALFQTADAWQTVRAREMAQGAGNAYEADPAARPRALVVRQLSDIVNAARKPGGTWTSENSKSFQDAQRAADILRAMRQAEELNPVPESDTVDFQGNLELPSGELPAGNDASLQHHAEFGERVARGDIVGALQWARDNLTSSTNKLIGPMATMAARPDVAIQVQIEEQAQVVRGRTVEAWYDPQTATIHITRRSAGTPYYLLHETAHALTENAIQNPDVLNESQRQALNTLYELYEEARDQGLLPEYATQSLSEFVAETWSNPDVQARLGYKSEVPGVSKLHNAFKAVTNLIRRMLGVPSTAQNALESIAVGSYAISSAAQRQADAQVEAAVDATVQQDFAVMNAFVRDPDAPHKKTWAASIVPMDDQYQLRFADGRPAQLYEFQEEAAQSLRQQIPDAQIRNASRREQTPTEPINDADNLTPLAKAVRAGTQALVGRADPRRAQQMADTLTARLRYFKHLFVNRMAVLEELQRRTGEPIHDRYMAEQSRQTARYNREAGDISNFVKSVGEGLKAINSSSQRFGDYLYALHVEERNKDRAKDGKDATAFTYWYNGQHHTNPTKSAARANELAQEYLNTLTAQEREVFSRLERQMRAMMDEMLADEYNLGMYTEKQYLALGGTLNGGQMPNAYKHYVPLLNEGNAGSSVPGVAVTGRDTKAANPFESVYEQLIHRAERLSAMSTRKDLLRLFQEHPNPELGTIQPTNVVWTGSEFESKGLSRRQMDNSIFVPEKGGWVRIELQPGHPQAPFLLEAFRQQAENKDVGRFLSVMSSATRALSSFLTTYNPGFLLKAMSWDLTTTLFNFQGAYDRDLPVAQAYKLSGQAVLEAGRALGMERTGVVRGAPSDRDPVMALFNEMGGGVNMSSMIDPQQRRAGIRKEMLGFNADTAAEARSHPILTARAVGGRARDQVQQVLHAPSMALRYGGFKAYLEHKAGRSFGPDDTDALLSWLDTDAGQTALRNAVRGSKNISGNFEQRGSARVMPSLFAFWNAGMQGTQLFASMAGSRQGQIGMASLVVLGAAFAAQAIDDPDDEAPDGGSKYARSRDRTQSLLLNSESGFQWPIPYELRVPLLIGQAFTLVSSGKLSPTESFSEIVGATRDMFVPSYGMSEDDSAFATAMMTIPTAFQATVLPIGLGKDPFGENIDPEYIRMPDGRWSDTFRTSEAVNNDTHEWVADFTRWADENTDGRINWSPARLSQMTDNILGGTGRFVRQALSTPDSSIGFGSSSPVQRMTRPFRARDGFAGVEDSYTEAQQNFQAKIRRMQESLGGNDILSEDPAMNQARKINNRVEREVDNITIAGVTQAEIYQMLDDAEQNNNEAAGMKARELLQSFYDEKARRYADALRELEAIEERYNARTL